MGAKIHKIFLMIFKHCDSSWGLRSKTNDVEWWIMRPSSSFLCHYYTKVERGGESWKAEKRSWVLPAGPDPKSIIYHAMLFLLSADFLLFDWVWLRFTSGFVCFFRLHTDWKSPKKCRSLQNLFMLSVCLRCYFFQNIDIVKRDFWRFLNILIPDFWVIEVVTRWRILQI